MNDDICDRSYDLAPGVGSFYGDWLVRCRLTLKGGDACFFHCILVDCTFEPPLIDGGVVNTDWMKRFFATLVTSSLPHVYTVAAK